MCDYLSYCEEVDAWGEIVASQMLGVEPGCRQVLNGLFVKVEPVSIPLNYETMLEANHRLVF